MIITAKGMVIGQTTATAAAAKITAQAWAIRARPFQLDRVDRPAHSSGVKKVFGSMRAATAMAAIMP